MVIEIVTWPGAKRHALNQDYFDRTLCGVLLPKAAEKLHPGDVRCPTGVACTGCRYCETEREKAEYPDCMRCQDSVMHS